MKGAAAAAQAPLEPLRWKTALPVRVLSIPIVAALCLLEERALFRGDAMRSTISDAQE